MNKTFHTKLKYYERNYLKVMNCTTQEPTMSSVTKVTNIYNPY